MTTINITDSTAVEVALDLAPSANFGKTPASVVHFVETDILPALGQTIDQVKLQNLSLGFDYTPSFQLGAASQFTLGGGLKSSFSICRAPEHSDPDDPPALFDEDPFGDEAISLKDVCYTQLQCTASITAGDQASATAYTALTAGATVEASASMYLPYAEGSGYPTLKQALADAFSGFSIPATRADFEAFPQGRIFAFDTSGELTASGQFDLLTLVNPTVAAGLAGNYGPLSLSAGPSITLGGSITLDSDFQVRIRKPSPNVLRVGHYRKKGSTLGVTFDAGISADATFEGFDLVGAVFGLLGSNAKIDKKWIQANGAAGVADEIHETLKAAVQQKLSIALDAECDVSASDSAAFLFDFNMAQLDASGQSALEALVRGDLSPLVMSKSLPVGVTQRTNIIERIRSTSHTLSVNFLGLLSYADVATYALDSVTKFTENGEIVMTDSVTASDLAVTAAPMVASQKLHHVLASLFTATVSYSCSTNDSLPHLVAHKQFYEYEKSISGSILAWFLDIANELGAPFAVPRGSSGGSGWIDMQLDYDKETAKLLFLDASGQPRSADFYANTGRNAMALAVHANPALAYLAAMQPGQPYWDQIVQQDTGIRWTMNDTQRRVFGMVCFAVNDWASAMAGVSSVLQQMIAYANAHPGPQLAKDADFLKLRGQLASHLKQAAAKLEGEWVPSWSLFAVYLSHKPSSGSISLGAGKQGYTHLLA